MRKGQKHTKEAKEKNRLAHLGKYPSEETKRKMRESAKGFNGKHSEETKRKISKTLKRLYIEGKKVPWNKFSKIKAKRLPTKKIHKIWCEYNQFYRVPKGFLIHHFDLNPMNNNPNNLILIDKYTHDILHNKIIKMQIREVN